MWQIFEDGEITLKGKWQSGIILFYASITECDRTHILINPYSVVQSDNVTLWAEHKKALANDLHSSPLSLSLSLWKFLKGRCLGIG
jgi:hypothetical protein